MYCLCTFLEQNEEATVETNIISPYTNKRLLEAKGEQKDNLIPKVQAAGALVVPPRAQNQQD